MTHELKILFMNNRNKACSLQTLGYIQPYHAAKLKN